VRRLVGICTVAVAVCAAMALFARAQSRGTSETIVVTGQDYPSWFFYKDSATSLPRSLFTVTSSEPPRAVAVGTPDALTFFSFADIPNTVATMEKEVLQSATGEITEVDFVFGYPAGYRKRGFSGDGGDATDAELSLSQDSLVERSGIAVAADGTIYIADTKNSTIRAVAGAKSSEPGIIRSVAGKWGPRQNVTLVEPMGIAVDRAGNLYVADHGAGAVDVLFASTGQLETLAQVASPASITVNADGTKVFVASPETGGVFEIPTAAHAIAAIAGFAPTSIKSTDSGPSPCAAFAALAANPSEPAIAEAVAGARAQNRICPAGLAVDGRGNLFVADANSGRILRVDGLTTKTTVAVTGMIAPGDIAFDPQGDLFASEQGRARILAMGALGDPVSNLSLSAPASPFPAPCPQVTSPYTFCNEPQGGTTKTAAFTLTNNSATTAATGLAVTPPIPTNPPTQPPTNFTVESMTCTATLPANSSCTINVAFTPQSTGAITGTLSVTDTQGDSTSTNLAGTGDDYELALASGQTQELTVAQGTTATWNAQLTADSVFGTNGEQVTLLCPTNLPAYTFCVFNPCPLAAAANGTTKFTVAITTASKTKPLPSPVPSSCTATAGVAPGGRGPDMIIQLAPQTVSGRARAPALALLAGVSLAMGLALLGFGSRLRRAWRVPLIFATAGIAAAIIFGCGGGAATTIGVTPVGVTTMTIVGDALDANGNPLNAARQMQVTLDVVQGK